MLPCLLAAIAAAETDWKPCDALRSLQRAGRCTELAEYSAARPQDTANCGGLLEVGICSPEDEAAPGRKLSWFQPRSRRLRGGSLGAGRFAAGTIVPYEPGPPVAALAAPGSCVLGEEWAAMTLSDRKTIAHDVVLLTFALPNAAKPLGLSTCACLLARGQGTVRPYTPVSTNARLGSFQLMVKAYPDGALSQHLATLPVGGTVEYKHMYASAGPPKPARRPVCPTPDHSCPRSLAPRAPRGSPVNVKIQYPFGARKILMLVGGTGITPMLQALHAILGTPGDTTRVTLLYSNKAAGDILARQTLDAWAAAHPRRLKVVHTLTREPTGSSWDGHRGRIDRSFLEKHGHPGPGTLVFICGPPAMYADLSGARGEKALSGVLADLGYRAEQVVKF